VHTSWPIADQETLLHLYRSLIRSKLNYGCIVYGSARGSYLRMLHPIQNDALHLCLGAYRTSLASSLCMGANEPPLYFRREKLWLQYCLKLSCNCNNPACATVFNSKFHSVFERKPTQLPFLAVRVSGDLQAVGFKKSDVITSSIPTTPPWLLTRPAVNLTLHCSDKSNTPSEIVKHRFYELCHEFKNYYCIFTDGSKEGNRVAAAVVHWDNTECFRLPDAASRAELYALLLAIDVVRCSKEKNFVIFSYSMSSLQSIYGFNLDSDLIQKFLKHYTILTKNGKNVILCGSQVMWESSIMKKQMQLQSRHFPYLSLVWSFLPPTCILV